ncbi:hypothetical protein [Fibrobacter sp.]|uniref:hypothetical protein n=1 Tax=Fibrobacter sp. TaxID=35828 RepID=UPI0038699C59
MNKKFVAGISLAVVAGATFWACGEGNISKWNTEDEALEYQYGSEADAEALKKEGLDNCLADDFCKMEYAPYFAELNGETPGETPSSNDNGNNPGPNPGQSSSSVRNNNPFDIVDASSSSITRRDDDPLGDQSSSSEEVPITGLGMCEPVTTPIDKNTGSTKWKFTPNLNAGYTAIDFAKATYAWNFGAGATPATDGTPSTSAAVSYGNSGTATASVTVTIGGGSETIQCKPLQVNGDPITGCKCTTEATSVDYTATPDVVWSVTGCTSASMPLAYNWNGTDGSESFSNSFSAATDSYAPKLKVGNSDNTVIDVTCPAVKVTEGPEYTIKESGDAGEIAIPQGTHSVTVMGPSSLTQCRFECTAGGPLTVKLGTGTTLTGSYYAGEGVSAEFCKSTFDLNASTDVSCKARWN